VRFLFDNGASAFTPAPTIYNLVTYTPFDPRGTTEIFTGVSEGWVGVGRTSRRARFGRGIESADASLMYLGMDVQFVPGGDT
jgi:hypothetical protein